MPSRLGRQGRPLGFTIRSYGAPASLGSSQAAGFSADSSWASCWFSCRAVGWEVSYLSFGLRRRVNSPALPDKRRNLGLLSGTTAAIQWQQLHGDKRAQFVGEKVVSP